MASWTGLLVGLAFFQFLLGLASFFLGDLGHAPHWRYVEPFQFPLLSWTDPAAEQIGDFPWLARLMQIPLALMAMVLPPTWALWRVRGAKRFPLFRTLGVHLVFNLLCTALFLACGFRVYWDAL